MAGAWDTSRLSSWPSAACVVRENLRVVRAARDGDVGHAAVEQVFRAEFGVHVDQDAVGGLALAGMAGDSVTVIEM